MDFQVHKPIVVSDLGVFDSGQDGIRGTVATSLWLLEGQSNRLVASATFTGDEGTLEQGTGSRFLPLAEPIGSGTRVPMRLSLPGFSARTRIVGTPH